MHDPAYFDTQKNIARLMVRRYLRHQIGNHGLGEDAIIALFVAAMQEYPDKALKDIALATDMAITSITENIDRQIRNAAGEKP